MESFTFRLQTEDARPLYEQLYRHIISEMQAGRLREGEKVPSKRALCAHLGVSRSTVETAYGLLCAEGYLRAVPKSGYYVSAQLETSAAPPPEKKPAPIPQIPPPRYDFSTSAVDTSQFPFASWAKLTREAVSGHPELLQRGDPRGDEGFRRALADFLREYRGVRCDAGQIIIGAGLEYLLSVLVQLLPRESVFAVEDPGYGALVQVLRSHDRRICPIPLDEAGMREEVLRASGATVAYVTPSHQFPMGITMPAGRRSRLLRWAAEKPGRYLIEDDYDSEFRYTSRPIPAMQGMEERGRVIYIGTFSRSLAASVRVAYLVLPEALLPCWENQFGRTASTVSRFEQQTLCYFLERGLYIRHLRRMTNHYRKKQQLLLQALREMPSLTVSGAEAGLHFLVTVPGKSEQSLLAAAEQAGLPLRGLRSYALQAEPAQATLVLGFAGLREDQIPAAAQALLAVIRQA